MNATLVISVTAVVMAIAITIAVFFKITGDADAHLNNYKVSFTTEHSYPDGTVYATGSGTIVVNAGVQSFTYTDNSSGQTTLQEDSGLTFVSQDDGANFACAGDMGGINYASATPQAVASSVVEEDNSMLMICGDGEALYTLTAYETDFMICTTAAGEPVKVLSSENFVGTVTSFEMSKDEAFAPVTVPDSAEVNVDFCEVATSPVSTCTITAGGGEGAGESDVVDISEMCCSALNAWQTYEIDGSSTAMGDCEAFDLCAGKCGSYLEGVWHLIDASAEDDETKAEAATAKADFDAYCALQDLGALGQACEDSGRRALLFDDLENKHWRERVSVVASKPMQQANPMIVSKEEKESNTVLNNLAHEERNLRVSAINRRRLIAEHGEDFHRHLSSDEIERKLSEKKVCFMHGMGGTDHAPDAYWGVDAIKALAPSADIHWITTNSKYCDFWDSNSHSHSKCSGDVPGNFLDSNGQVNHGNAAGSRGSLPRQYKAFIDHHECNVIFAHSMGNPTMAEVVRLYGNDYKWYDTQGPMKGSTAAAVVADYTGMPWVSWTSFFSVKGFRNVLMKALVSGMGYAGTGNDKHNALYSMIPTSTSKWAANHGSCVNDAISWNSAASCSDRAGGSHLQVTTVKTKWFEISEKQTRNVQQQVKKCQKKWWKFWCWFETIWVAVDEWIFSSVCKVEGTCEDAGETKISAAGVLGALCGQGSGLGLGTPINGWFGQTGGDWQNIGLWAIHAITGYGELSDGMVGWTSCTKPIEEAQGAKSWSGSYTSNWYAGDMSHLDGTGFSGDSSISSKKPNHWFAAMIGKPTAGSCSYSAYYETRHSYGGHSNYCDYWKQHGYCGWHSWVQAQCPCACA
jgi:hypothetical protein